MKICLYGNLNSALYGKPRGGGELQLVYLALGLSNAGQKVVLVDFEDSKDYLFNDNLEVISLNNYLKNKFRILKYYHLYKLFQAIKADIYHCRIRGWIHIISYLASRKTKSLFTISLASNLDVSSFIDRYYHFYKYKNIGYSLTNGILTEILFPFILKNAHKVFAQNSIQGNKLRKKNIDFKYLNNIYSEKQIRIDLPRVKDNYFVYVGSLDLRKGFDTFLKLVEKLSNIEFKVIGNIRGNWNQEYNFKNLEYMGRLPHLDTISKIAQSKALISTSRMEGFPNIFIEAWAQGVPVISYSVNPNDLLKIKKLGIYCENNFDYLKDCIISFDAISFNKLDLIKYVRETHSSEIVTKRFLNCIKHIND